MVKISELPDADAIHERHMRDDPEYAREYKRTQFANEVAIMVLSYRTQHGLSQSQLARMLGMRQPNIARLESGEHEPSLATLARLSDVLGFGFDITVEHGHVGVRKLVDALLRVGPLPGAAGRRLRFNAALGNPRGMIRLSAARSLASNLRPSPAFAHVTVMQADPLSAGSGLFPAIPAGAGSRDRSRRRGRDHPSPRKPHDHANLRRLD